MERPSSEDVIAEVRKVFQSKEFNELSSEGKQDYLDRMLENPQVIAEGLTRDDLLNIYSQGANLDNLPVEVLVALMSSLSFQDAKRLCSSTPILAQRCKRSDLLELKAREYVADVAPGTAPITSYAKYANLLERGFETIYHVGVGEQYSGHTTDLDGVKYARMGYGGPNSANFGIPGFPSEEPREGFLCVKHGYDSFNGFEEDVVTHCDFYYDYDDAEIRREELDSGNGRDSEPYILRVRF